VGKHDGKLKRPFVESAQVRCRGYSGPLQRAITDFGADTAFGQVAAKLAEHYGITLPPGTAAVITEHHARALREADTLPLSGTRVAPLTLIAETDGSMIPMVETGKPADPTADKRKHRTLFWKEARLCLVRRPDELEPTFAVTLGDASVAGTALKRLALAAGLNRRTRVHGLGDGALWIAEQIEIQFGAQGTYLIDFYHLCDYLAAAAPSCATDSALWVSRQKERFKAGKLATVMAVLATHVEPDSIPNEQAPVRACQRYIANRPGQFNYRAAIAADLPIGSGEVESAHRYVIQKRLKLPGAWWAAHNAQAMLNLRTMRANHRWRDYWNQRDAA
jgi:hypothetical protein